MTMTSAGIQPGMLVYIRDEENVWKEGEVKSVFGPLCTVMADNKKVECSEDDILMRPDTSLVNIKSLTDLPFISQASVLCCLHERYSAGIYYTGAGSTIVAVNPFSDAPSLYSLETALNYHLHKTEGPHIFRVGAEAYSCMVRELGKINQCIIVSGESGAGKTVSAKHLVRYMTLVSNAGPHDQSSSRASVIGQSIERRILDSNPILEAFGNAVTQRNDNSSRFGKFIQLQFSRNGQLEGANIKTYLLEKTRVVHQSSGECNFHIFYQIMKELKDSQSLFGECHEEITMKDFKILPFGKEIKENRLLQTTRDAMSEIGLSDDLQENIFMVLVSILYLGNIEFNPFEDDMSKLVADPVTQQSLQKAAAFLGLTPSHMEQVFLYRNITSGSNSRQSVFIKPVPQQEAYSRRDCLATVLYLRVFEWLVSYINSQIQAEDYCHTIGLLDIYGFEAFEKNSLEQLCINYANEKLQQHYVRHFLRDLQKEYEAERINWKFMKYTDNQPCLDVLEGQPSVFGLLNEEVQLNRKSDTRNLCERILQLSTSRDNPLISKNKYVKTPKYFRKDPGFTICHYAGEVTYRGEELITKNKDNIPQELIAMLQESKNPFVAGLFDDFQVEDNMGRRRKTVLGKFKVSLDSLMTALKSSDVHYIRCIKPNTAGLPGVYDRKYVMSQLLASGIIETVEISQQGFPARMCYSSFLHRYGLIIRNITPAVDSGRDSLRDDETLFDALFKSQLDMPDSPRKTPTPRKRLRRRAGLSSVDHTRQCCAAVLKILFGSCPSLIKQFGKTKLFLYQHQVEKLESTRQEILSCKAALIQRSWIWYRYKKIKWNRNEAATKIQQIWRTFREKRRREAVLLIQKRFRVMKARKHFIRMQQKAKRKRKHSQKSWRPIIDRKWASSSRSQSSGSRLSNYSRDSTLSDSSRDMSPNNSCDSDTSLRSAKSGLSQNLSDLSISMETENSPPREERSKHSEINAGAKTSTAVEGNSESRRPFSQLKENHQNSDSRPVKKMKTAEGSKTTLEDLHVGDDIVTRRHLPKVPIRFHTRPSVLKHGHFVHKKEFTRGLQDCLPDGLQDCLSVADYRSPNKENC